MSGELAAMLAATLTVGVALAGLTLAAWRDVRAEIRDLRESIEADRRAHEAQHAAERADHAADMRELRAAIAGRPEAA